MEPTRVLTPLELNDRLACVGSAAGPTAPAPSVRWRERPLVGFGDDPERREVAETANSRPRREAALRFESTVRYLGIEVDDALEISEQTEI